MTGDAEGPIDLDSLEPGRSYRVDYKHERLRRSFRCVGTYLGAEERPSPEPGGDPVRVLVFEVKPRFGKPASQPIEVATIQAIEAVPDADR
jgi:hypothetical protein